MAGINKVILIGHLGQDPEIKNTPSGMSVCNFTIATSESWKDKSSGEKKEKTEWHRVTTWGKLADLCGQYLSKGRQAYVEGKLQTRSWDDKEGNKKYVTEIIATTVNFIGSNSEGNNSSVKEKATPANDFALDDIPF